MGKIVLTLNHAFLKLVFRKRRVINKTDNLFLYFVRAVSSVVVVELSGFIRDFLSLARGITRRKLFLNEKFAEEQKE